MPWPAPTRYLDPAVLARLGTLDLKAKTIVEGVLSGLHRSPFRGFSVEFAEYRQYMPGDALSTIDWKVFARTDRHYVKKFEEDTNLDCHLLLDVSGSMGYGSGAVTKREYGCYLAASLAYLMHRQRDAVGLIAFDDQIVHRVPPGARAGHLKTVLLALERLPRGPAHRRRQAARRPGQGAVASAASSWSSRTCSTSRPGSSTACGTSASAAPT